MTKETEKTFVPDKTCNAYVALPNGEEMCQACTVMWRKQQAECKFYGAQYEGKLVPPCLPCKKYKPGCEFGCPEISTYNELIRRCEAAGIPPVIDRKTAKRLHRDR